MRMVNLTLSTTIRFSIAVVNMLVNNIELGNILGSKICIGATIRIKISRVRGRIQLEALQHGRQKSSFIRFGTP